MGTSYFTTRPFSASPGDGDRARDLERAARPVKCAKCGGEHYSAREAIDCDGTEVMEL